jgi:hypothetical protein
MSLHFTIFFKRTTDPTECCHDTLGYGVAYFIGILYHDHVKQ